MPAKNRIKSYVQGGYYYIYNSGVDNRDIFIDDEDYHFFLNLLKLYLSPLDELSRESANSKFKTERPYLQKIRQQMNLHQDVTLHAFCLMPKRIQLVIHQSSVDGITKFMRRLSTSYVTYFNKRHHRSGNLFSGVYKAVLLQNNAQIQELIKQIHLEPVSVRKIGLISTSSGSAASYPYSSYHLYISKQSPSWLNIGQTFSA
jgi:REP element-mobilizing transposase RayT